MEQTLLLNKYLQDTPVYKRYSISTEADKAPVVQLHSREFFYIGRNTRSIDYLVALFEGGYAAESVEKAISILDRIEKQSKSIPQVFILDSGVNLDEVTKMTAYIRNSEKLRTIPVIMDKSNSTA